MNITQNTPRSNSMAKRTLFIVAGTSGREILSNFDHIADYAGYIERVAFDADRTQSYPLRAEPLFDDIAGSSQTSETFLHCPPPHPDWLSAVKRGEKPGQADFVSPSIPNLLSGEEDRGVGGLPPLGRLAVTARRKQVQGVLRKALLRITKQRVDHSSGELGSLRIIELGTWVGGFATGSMDEIHDCLRAVVKDLGMEDEVNVERYVLLPGTNDAKDNQGARAIAAAQFREYTARCTGYYQDLVKNGKGWVQQSSSVPVTTFLTDKSNGPNVKTRSVKDLFSVMAHALYLRTGPLSAHMERDQIDLQKIERQAGVYGESRTCRSFGLSIISLDRGRVRGYLRERLSSKVLEVYLGRTVSNDSAEEAGEAQDPGIDDDEVKHAVRAFLKKQALLEGKDHTDLSRSIKERVEGGIGRFDSLYNVPGKRTDRLKDAPLALEQVRETLEAEWDDELPIVRQHKIDEVSGIIRKRIESTVRKSGLSTGDKWCGQLLDDLDLIYEKAEAALGDRADRVEALEAGLAQLADEVIAEWLEANPLKRWVNGDELDRVENQFHHEGRELILAVFDRKASEEALEVIGGVRQSCRALHLEIDELLERVEAVRRRATAEVERITHHDTALLCPDGIELAVAQEHGRGLEDIYYDLLREDNVADREAIEDDQAERILFQLLEQYGQLLQNESANAEETHTRLSEIIEARFKGALGDLHVQRELMRRYGEGENLKGVLEERHQEAFEALRLDRTAEDDAHRLRYLVGDSLKGETLTTHLNKAVRDGASYRFIDSGDADKLYFFQVRQAIGLGHIDDLDTYERNYQQRSLTGDEHLHTSPVGRHLPVPNHLVNAQDVQEAMVKAHAIDYASGDKDLLEHTEGGADLQFRFMNGERWTIRLDQTEKQRAFEAQVEVVTRFYNGFRLHGSRILYDQLDGLQRICEGDATPNNKVEEVLGASIEVDAIERVRGHLKHYEQNTIEESALWKH